MKRFLLGLNLLLMAATAVSLVGCSTQRPSNVLDTHSKLGVGIVWDDHKGIRKEINAVWLCYLMSRAVYVNKHRDMYSNVKGRCIPCFNEEVDARTQMAEGYQRFSAEDGTLHDDYLDDLVKVEKAGFMKEYVWTYLRQSSWSDAEKPTKMTDFATWKEVNLSNHHAVTYGYVFLH